MDNSRKGGENMNQIVSFKITIGIGYDLGKPTHWRTGAGPNLHSAIQDLFNKKGNGITKDYMQAIYKEIIRTKELNFPGSTSTPIKKKGKV